MSYEIVLFARTFDSPENVKQEIGEWGSEFKYEWDGDYPLPNVGHTFNFHSGFFDKIKTVS